MSEVKRNTQYQMLLLCTTVLLSKCFPPSLFKAYPKDRVKIIRMVIVFAFGVWQRETVNLKVNN